MPATLPAPQYDGHLLVRRVSRAGTFRFRARQLFLSDTLMEEDIALEEVDDGVWSILFYDALIARLDERDWRISGESGKNRRGKAGEGADTVSPISPV